MFIEDLKLKICRSDVVFLLDGESLKSIRRKTSFLSIRASVSKSLDHNAFNCFFLRIGTFNTSNYDYEASKHFFLLIFFSNELFSLWLLRGR